MVALNCILFLEEIVIYVQKMFCDIGLRVTNDVDVLGMFSKTAKRQTTICVHNNVNNIGVYTNVENICSQELKRANVSMLCCLFYCPA